MPESESSGGQSNPRKSGIREACIELSRYRFIDVYFNERTGTLNSALLEKGRRILGINGYQKRVWHMHPFGRAREHITVRPMRIEKVLRQYALFLRKKSPA